MNFRTSFLALFFLISFHWASSQMYFTTGDYAFGPQDMWGFVSETEKVSLFDWNWQEMEFLEHKDLAIHTFDLAHFLSSVMDKYSARFFKRYLGYLFMVKDFKYEGQRREWYAGRDVALINSNLVFTEASITYRQLAFHFMIMDVMMQWLKLESLGKQIARQSKLQHLTFMQEAIPFSPNTSKLDARLYPLGYISLYSLRSPASEIQAISAAMFSAQPGFWDAYDRFPVIRAKSDLVIDLWHRIDSSFDQKYLRSLRPDDWQEWELRYANEPVPNF